MATFVAVPSSVAPPLRMAVLRQGVGRFPPLWMLRRSSPVSSRERLTPAAGRALVRGGGSLGGERSQGW
jgi:hypothetical protein